jgi:phospholipid N-methyltransferase
MLRHVHWEYSPQTIVELGGGTGPMTRALISRKGENTQLTSCELDEDRYNRLKYLTSESIKIVHLDAEKCLSTFARGSVDLIISTLPLGSMPPEHARDILKAAADVLSPNGQYIQYQYFATNRKDVEQFFVIEKVDWEAMNFPPAFIYICKKR